MIRYRSRRCRGASQLAIGLTALVLLASACSKRSDGGSTETTKTPAASTAETSSASDTTAAPAASTVATSPGTDATASAGESTTGTLDIIMVSGPLFDPFFSALKKGADDAASDLGVNLEYATVENADNFGPDLARLTQNAVTKHPDGLAVGNYFPDAQGPEITRGVKAGIPLVMVNGGEATWRDFGALTYIGQDETLAGEQGAQTLIDAGAKNILCVNHVPGNPTVEARCIGAQKVAGDNGAKSSVLNIASQDANNPTAVVAAIRGQLQADSSIDAVFTLGSGIAESALRAVDDAGLAGKVMVGTTDLSKNVLQAVADKELLFAIDQQPYLQGYYAVQVLAQYVRYGLLPAAPPRTGPLVVNTANVAAVQKANESGVRGAA